MAGNLAQLPTVLVTDPVNGVPASGALWNFYENGTSTPKDTYTTSDLSTPHTNPVEADAGGYFPEIWLDGVYSWKLTDADGVLIDEGDDLAGFIMANRVTTFSKLITFDGGFIDNPEHATDGGTDEYDSATNTTAPPAGTTIRRDFQSANTTTTPSLDSLTITTRDGSALWASALSGPHTLQLASDSGSWLVLDPRPQIPDSTDLLDEDDMASDSDTAVPTQQSVKAYADTKARIATGTYTGDGTESQSITGVGFQPVYLQIIESSGTDGASVDKWETSDVMIDDNASGMAYLHPGPNTVDHQLKDDRIISLDSDGFTVDDDGADAAPNANGVTYNYVAIG